jgi:starch phosphorylase
MLLGIGGWRLLAALGIAPEVCHLNEGHAAFAVLERARTYMQENRQTFAVALAVTRAGNLFTTHTAVPAGFDRFDPSLCAQYLRGYAEQELHITLDDLLALGRLNPQDAAEPFNMSVLAIRGSGAVNAVSRLHRKVSRQLFEPLFPRWPVNEVPIGYVTNGVHTPTWDSVAADKLWTEACGKQRWLGTTDMLEQGIRCIPDATLWQFRSDSRTAFVSYARDRMARQLALSGASTEVVAGAQHLFDRNTLTLGFARRFAAYKRPNLLLHDPERLVRLLTDPLHPLQLVIAGKAHPADQQGRALIAQWMAFIRRPEVAHRVIFLSDYDMLMAAQLVQGVDLWLNTPRRPWEASGTSGMKILVNGGLNLSELDGWWAEDCTPEVGWALGDGQEHDEDPGWDASEAETLYNLLEYEVIPAFYTRNEHGIPCAWVARMRESMARLTPQFSSNRVVREYTEQYYLPAAAAYRERAANDSTGGVQLVRWRDALQQSWPAVHFGSVDVRSDEQCHVFEGHLYLDKLPPEALRVELYAEGIDGGVAVRMEMQHLRQLADDPSTHVYCARVPATRPACDYTLRVIPHHAGASTPLEDSHILWQH